MRLVATARLRDPVLRKLIDDESQMADIAEIEAATSGRLMAEKRGAEALDSRELVAGVPHAHFINAAFSYWLPRDRNRFSHSGRGAWYAAFATKTALAEVIFHLSRELANAGDYRATVDYAEMFASFAGEFVDLRGQHPAPACLHPEPSIGYPAGNALAETVRQAGHNGIIYPSVRDEGGTCLVALHPQAVQSVAQGGVLRVKWAGHATPQVTRVAG